MANYTTVRRVRRTLGSRGSTSFKGDVIEEAIDNAMGLVQGIIGGETSDKIDAAQTGADDEAKAESTNKTIRMLTNFISAHFAYAGEFGAQADSDDDFSSNYEDAIQWLEDVRDGKIDIPGIELNLLPKSTTQDFQPAFQVDDPTKHRIDSDRLRDISDDRS